MSFLNPTYLWALLGLAVPLAIHLWSKKEGRTIKVGSIRLLSESDPRKTSSLRPNELWLLLLRMLALTVLVFILAEPFLKSRSENIPLTYLVEPSLLSYEKVNSFLDSIPANVPVRLLTSGFPDLKNESIHADNFPPNYWQLAKEMEVLPTDSIIVLTNAFVSGVKGKRPEIEKNINWVLLDPEVPTRKVVQAISRGDEVELTRIKSDHKVLKFEIENFPKNSDNLSFSSGNDSLSVSSKGEEIQVEIKTADPLTVLIVKNAIFEQEVKLLKASYAAIAEYLGQSVEVEVVSEEDYTESESYRTVVWLSELPAPKTTGNIIILEEDSLANQIILDGNSEKEYRLTTRLNSENIVEEDLPERLLMLLDLNKELEEKITQYDQRIMNLDEFQPVSITGVSENRTSAIIDISYHLWILLLILLLTERGFSFYRKQ